MSRDVPFALPVEDDQAAPEPANWQGSRSYYSRCDMNSIHGTRYADILCDALPSVWWVPSQSATLLPPQVRGVNPLALSRADRRKRYYFNAEREELDPPLGPASRFA